MKKCISLIGFLFFACHSFSQEKMFALPSAAPTTVQQILQCGHPGPASAIRIRCGRSIDSGNTPLIIVDGVPYESSEQSKIDPVDILEVFVLKSPTAETIYGCRALHGVIIITTKKAYHRKFIVRDAKTLLAVSHATVKAKSLKTGKVSYFVADAYGRFETDSLKTTDYMMSISSSGYKAQELSLQTIQQNKGEIKLEPAFVELEEVVVTGKVISCGRAISTSYHNVTYCGMSTCSVRGIVIEKEKEKRSGSVAPYKTSGLEVYPSPVAASGSINISFPNVKPGQYQIRLLNATGQLFYSFQKQISSKGETEQIHLSDKIIPGMYIVQVIDEQKKLLHTNKIIVQ